MDSCKRAENLIMQHIESRLEPKEANTLAKHVLKCKNCRELYLMMDRAVEVATKEAPEGFTASVMARIDTVAEPAASFAKKIITGTVGLIFIAVVFVFAYSPALSPALYTLWGELLSAFLLIRDFAVDIIRQFTPEVNLNITIISFVALALMLVSGGLAYVLQQGDKEKSLA